MARGIQFAAQRGNRNTIYSRPMRFDMICEVEPRLRHRSGRPWRDGIAHRPTKPNHPSKTGQVERMNRMIKEATIKRFHYETQYQLRTHLTGFLAAYNFVRRLKTLGGLTPCEYICKIWSSEPDRSIPKPIHQLPGLNTKHGTGKRPTRPTSQKNGNREFRRTPLYRVLADLSPNIAHCRYFKK